MHARPFVDTLDSSKDSLLNCGTRRPCSAYGLMHARLFYAGYPSRPTPLVCGLVHVQSLSRRSIVQRTPLSTSTDSVYGLRHTWSFIRPLPPVSSDFIHSWAPFWTTIARGHTPMYMDPSGSCIGFNPLESGVSGENCCNISLHRLFLCFRDCFVVSFAAGPICIPTRAIAMGSRNYVNSRTPLHNRT